MKTRNAKSDVPSPSLADKAGHQLQASAEKPPQLFVLPRNLSHDARFVVLVDHATQSPRRHLFCPVKGMFELKRFSPPKNLPRSWLLDQNSPSNKSLSSTETSEECTSEGSSADAAHFGHDASFSGTSPGYALRDSSILIATPLDPMFLLLPLFDYAIEQDQRGRARSFLCEDDHLDRLAQGSKRVTAYFKTAAMKRLLLTRLSTVSQTQEIGTERFYKPDPTLLVKELIAKAITVTETAWASSLNNDFVTKPLIIPTTDTEDRADATLGPEPRETASLPDSLESSTQATAQGIAQSSSNNLPDEILRAMRVRVALDLILSTYFSKTLRDGLRTAIESNSIFDFTGLNLHLETSQRLRKQAQALRSLSENISRKRNLDSGELAESLAEKKRKKEEEDKKRKSVSRALNDLKKADTSGMKKLSSFFVKSVPSTT